MCCCSRSLFVDPACVIESFNYPSNHNLNATVGNGFVATGVNSDTTYLAGVFNGLSNVLPSRRARVPGFAALSVVGKMTKLALDVDRGVYSVAMILQNGASVEQTTFAHRTQRGLLVNRFCLTKGIGPANLTIVANQGQKAGREVRILLLLFFFFQVLHLPT